MKQKLSKSKKNYNNYDSTVTKHIVISEKNYLRLKNLGTVGDTFDDVITSLLETRE
jgi:hypothetical protein